MSTPALDVEKEILTSVNIPPQPEILAVLQAEVSGDSPNLDYIADKIAEDPRLFSTILRLINSPYFGMRCEIKSIKHAITLLGMDNIATTIASIIFKSQLRGSGYMPMPRYWDNAFDVARLSGYLAKELRISRPHDAYAVGMFKDVGIPILAQRFENYKEILAEQNVSDLNNYTDLEERNFNTNHCIVGYLLTRQWGMNKALREACLYHHDVDYITNTDTIDDQEARKLILIGKVADHTANLRRKEPQYEWLKLEGFILDYLCISELDFRDLRDEMLDYLSGV